MRKRLSSRLFLDSSSASSNFAAASDSTWLLRLFWNLFHSHITTSNFAPPFAFLLDFHCIRIHLLNILSKCVASQSPPSSCPLFLSVFMFVYLFLLSDFKIFVKFKNANVDYFALFIFSYFNRKVNKSFKGKSCPIVVHCRWVKHGLVRGMIMYLFQRLLYFLGKCLLSHFPFLLWLIKSRQSFLEEVIMHWAYNVSLMHLVLRVKRMINHVSIRGERMTDLIDKRYPLYFFV